MRKIYIILAHTGTILSNIIRYWTKDEFSHVSIALDADLEEMYSFGRLNPYNPFWGSFVHEHINKGTFKRFKNTTAKVYSIFVTDEQIEAGIENVQIAKKRMEIVNLKNNVTLVNDTYNASLESVKEALKYISNISSGRKIAVLGDILELGEFSSQIHEKIGKEVARQKIDVLICSGTHSEIICDIAAENGITKKINGENVSDFASR